jgi:hypothetical protein
MAVWYSLWSFGIFSPFWYVSTTKNLATLVNTYENMYNGRFKGLVSKVLRESVHVDNDLLFCRNCFRKSSWQ